ncbi:DUF6907 domain-containing protein [Streptomyces showdoensis]|uniref:DUF6907 domain-containing protein n=1 Tax=Streptomyces showdoensis TaxID=68268 RepID=UPI0013F4CB10|nr:GIY-YIG nuclease family protein [Streptomyces showdoensis]
MTERTALYRLYDAEDRLLYIGITKNLEQRWTGHKYSATSSKWWPSVSRKVIEWHPTLEAADAAETAAIVQERPAYNRAKQPYDNPVRGPRISDEIRTLHPHLDPHSERAIRILQAEIQSGVIKPGSPMPTRNQLHERFGLSANTCGEMLQKMAARGLVHQNGRAGRYYCSRPGDDALHPPRQKPKPRTPRDEATELQAVRIDGIPVEVVERRRRSFRQSRTLLGAHLQIRPYSLDPLARQAHVNIEVGPNEVVELDVEGLGTFIDQIEAQCSALRELQIRLQKTNDHRAA